MIKRTLAFLLVAALIFAQDPQNLYAEEVQADEVITGNKGEIKESATESERVVGGIEENDVHLEEDDKGDNGEDDSVSVAEANDTYAAGSSYTDAIAIGMNEIVTFTDPTPNDLVDKTNYYMFETGDKGIYSINFVSTGKDGIVLFSVVDAQYNKIYASDWLSYDSAQGENKELTLEENSVYYIRATAKAGIGTSAYTFKVKKGYAKSNIIRTGDDGSAFSSPISLTLGDTISYIDPTPEDNNDKYLCYTFNTTTNPGSVYNLNFVSSGKGGICEIWMVDSNYKRVYYSGWLFESKGQSAYKELELKDSSTYYIMTNANGAVGTVNASAYDLTITESINTKKAGKPIIASLKGGKKKFTVSYGAVTNGASGYQIAYRVKGSTKWKTVKVGGSTYSKTIKNLKSKTTYQVKVRALKTVNGADYDGKWSSVKSVKAK